MRKQLSTAGPDCRFRDPDHAAFAERMSAEFRSLRQEVRATGRIVVVAVTIFVASFNWTLFVVLKDA